MKRKRPIDTLDVRRESIDPLTGDPAPRGAPEAIDTGRMVATVHTPAGGRVRLHVASDDARYLVLRRRASAPLLRSATPPRIGATFASAEAALREFVGRNQWFFEADALDGADLSDVVRPWLDGLDSAIGKRHARAIDTRAGRRILAAPQGAPMVRAALRYVFGRAKGRRWRAVDWRDVDSLLGAVKAQLVDDVERTGVPAPAGAWSYPLGSGLVERDALVEQAAEDLGPRRARALVRWITSQDLWDLVDRGRRALAEGATCIGKPEARAARRRLGVMRRWALRPELMPDWACAASDRGGAAGLCLVPALAAEVAALEAACGVDYDAGAPRRAHAGACSAGRDTWGTGLPPCHVDDEAPRGPAADPFDPIDPIDEIPW